jgi:glycosyltransferase involved in cell wall biosynthesis
MDASQRPKLVRPSDIPSRYLFHPGPFAPEQNHVGAIRVLTAMAGMAAQPALVFAGADQGTQEHVMREADALGLTSRVINKGVVSREALTALYQHAEAVLHTSLGGVEEPVPLEAMALGCPVIAAHVAGADEQVGDAGILVEPMDADAYVSAIRTLRHDAVRRQALVEHAMHRAREWSAPQYAAAVLALVDSRVAPLRALWP